MNAVSGRISSRTTRVTRFDFRGATAEKECGTRGTDDVVNGSTTGCGMQKKKRRGKGRVGWFPSAAENE
jgi:hypothetical protein